MEFKLAGHEFILLQALLQVSGLSDTGGAAKNLIVNGEVLVDGEVETRRGKKIRAGQTVSYKGKQIRVVG